MPILNEINSGSINLESIYDRYPDDTFVLADGFDEAILGIDDNKMIIVYSTKKVISILMEDDDMSYEDAMDHFYFNIKGGYVGEKTPLFIDDIF